MKDNQKIFLENFDKKPQEFKNLCTEVVYINTHENYEEL